MHPVFAIITTPEIIIIGAVILVLFGAERLPKLARSMGQARKEFETASREWQGGSPPQPPGNPPPANPPPNPPISPPSANPPPQAGP
jgi:sec-independent protein translocase protein TatA